ncbi:MAG: isoprenylcysteine carboxylmethyltransferase family protein [Bacteroidetes bacterium]|nr:isoprenylcysteine carboxylmethyltransferase family protein [Bacteroidota bacterium]
MDKIIFFTLVVVCSITHVVRTVYEILKHKDKLKANKLTFVIVFINMMLLWMSWVALCSFDVYKIPPAGIVKLLGVLLIGTGIIVFLTGLFTIKTLESYDGDLITKGIYSKIRHPMYTGFILWLIGFPIFFGAVFSSVLSLIFIANILFWRMLEEKELNKRFPSYKDYKKTTIF